MFGNFPVAPQQDLMRFVSSSANQSQRTALSAKFTKYLAQFIRTGNPNKAFDGLPDWSDWSNFWIYQKRLILDNTVSSSSHDVWLSDVNAALNQLGTDDRQRVLEAMSGQQVQLEDADVSY
jgi:para-nitrobenzyl esterase